MAVTATSTARELINDALYKAGLLDIGEDAPADISEVARRELNRMLKAWQAASGLWSRTTQVVTVTNATQSYALASPARPLRVLSARFRRGGIDTPMQMLTREEYEDLPVKASVGLPTCFYFQRLREQATLFVWPVLAVANGETIRLNVEREVEDIAAPGDAVDVPAEWYDAVLYGLASRMCEGGGRTGQAVERIHLRAARALKRR
jgi:hypothetical protein